MLRNNILYLPEQDERFKIYFTSAGEYIDAHLNAKYDFILVDLFLTEKGKDITVDINSKIKPLSQLLTPNGYLCINIIGSEYLNYSGLNQLREAFSLNINVVSVELSNVVLIASHNNMMEKNSDIDFTSIEKRLGLPFKQHYNLMMPA